MKKLLLVAVIACAAISANAQVYLGGTAGVWRNDDNGAKTTSFQITPEIGYNFNESWAIGASLGYIYEKDNAKKSAFGISPYVRYSYYENEVVRLFLDGGFGYMRTKVGDNSENGFEVGIRPGIAIKLNDTFSMIGKVGFLGYRKDYLLEAGKSYGLALSGEDVALGIQVNF